MANHSCVTDPAVFSEIISDAPGLYNAGLNLTRSPGSMGDLQRKINSAAYIVSSLEKYARLSGAQRAQVETIVQNKYDGYVRQEKRAIARTYESQKSTARKSTEREIAAARQKAAADKAAAKARADARALAKAEADEQKRIAAARKDLEEQTAKIDSQWQKAAQARVGEQYGTDFAVPVKNSEGKPVVAFASVKDGQAFAQNDAYVIGSMPSSGKTVSHNSRDYVVTDQSIR